MFLKVHGRSPTWPGQNPVRPTQPKKHKFISTLISLVNTSDKVAHALVSGTKKEPKPKLLSPDIFLWGGDLPHEGVGGQRVRYVPRNQGNQTFLAGYPGICWDIPAVPEKFEKKKFVFNFLPLVCSAPLPSAQDHSHLVGYGRSRS